MATLEEIKELLGEPGFNWSDPAPWVRLEQELGVSFPDDFRAIADAYGPALIKKGFYLYHPGHPIRNLGEEIKESIESGLKKIQQSSFPVGQGLALESCCRSQQAQHQRPSSCKYHTSRQLFGP
ncbi:hypothetical protein [Streptomyces sp. NPDC055692]|uniref:hypothetical protein n=1 Tax=Streptomyces sp. NPDC055692 TaxID=3155683 RepID=UPI00341A96EC